VISLTKSAHGLFYNFLPKIHIPSSIKKKCHGGKLGQENVTVFVEGNKDGSKVLAISN
jgi:hypothetical protein